MFGLSVAAFTTLLSAWNLRAMRRTGAGIPLAILGKGRFGYVFECFTCVVAGIETIIK